MYTDAALDSVSRALMLALIISAPVLAVGLVVGLIVSVLQAVTQIQEQTISFVPKIVAMVLAGAFFLPWVAARMLDYAQQYWGGGPGAG
jgi:flagellar biosynthetic protein FliQ